MTVLSGCRMLGVDEDGGDLPWTDRTPDVAFFVPVPVGDLTLLEMLNDLE